MIADKNESDCWKHWILTLFHHACRNSDPRRDFELSGRERIIRAIQQLPADLAKYSNPLRIRAYLGDESCLRDLAHLQYWDRTATVGVLGTPKAIDYLKHEFSVTTDTEQRYEIAIALANAKDATGIALVKQQLLIPHNLDRHLQCAYALARLGDCLGMLFLLPLLEQEDESSFESKLLLDLFQRDRGFVDVRQSDWRLAVISKFREQILTADVFAIGAPNVCIDGIRAAAKRNACQLNPPVE
jgi:hypothetical protein